MTDKQFLFFIIENIIGLSVIFGGLLFWLHFFALFGGST